MNSTLVLCVSMLIAIYAVEHSSTLTFTTEPSDKVVAVGQPLILNCQVKNSGSGTIQVSWQNNGIWLLNPVNQPWRQLINNSLYYSSIPVKSIGTFRCGATILGTSQIIYSRTVTVQAAFIKPTYYTEPGNATKRLGGDVTFDCVLAESLPYAFIHWEKNGQTINTGETSEFHIPSTNATSSALSLRNITFSSSGWYGCVAVNRLLPSQPKRSRKAFLSVLPAKDEPHVNIHPSTMTVQEHKPAVLQCQILGIPMPAISWTQSGKPVLNTSDRFILSNGSLYFGPPVNRSYAGEYVCTGTNSLGSISSSPVIFSVAYLDFTFVKNPSNRTATVGDRVSIDCVPPLSHLTKVRIQWYHNYHLIVPTANITVSNAGTITFAAIKKSDEGSYFCDATSVHFQLTRTSTLAYVTVHVPPSFRGKPNNTNVTEGDPLMLHCQATGFPMPGVVWRKDNKPVNTSHVTVFSNGSLNIAATVVQDAGKFSCVASNIAGSAVTIAYVVIYVPPSVLSSPGNTTKAVGESITFECSFAGIPKPEIQWFYHNGISLPQLINISGKFVVSGGVLEINQIAKRDEGSYLCRAVNIAGSVEASTYLKVQVPASLDTRLVNITVNESSPASFHCNASGDPKPSVTWFKEARELTMGGRLVIGQDSLTIVNTVASDTGRYSCNVSNGLNSHLGVAYLLVQVSPNITSFHVPRLVALGRNASLRCAVSGIPQPQITWHRNGAQISMSRVHPQGNGMFVFDGVAEGDGGVYTCNAANAAGRQALSANMTVQVAPSPPVPISAIAQSSRMIRLSWKPGFDGHSPITGYKLEVKVASGRYESLETNISVTSYSASNLSPYTTYIFRIIALNAVGESQGATISNETLEDAPSPPRNLVATTLNASAITITWNEPVYPNGLITWYEIHYNAVDNSSVTMTSLLPANRLPVLEAVIVRLTPFTGFQFRLRAATGGSSRLWGNFSSWSNATTAEAAPDASPQDIQLEPLSSRSILVKWKPVPQETANGVVRKYVVYFQAAGPYIFSDARNVSVYGSLNFTLRSLHPWTQYNVSVQAFTVKAGPMSAWKQVQTLTSVPGPPSNITLIPVSRHNITVLITEPLPHMRNGAILGHVVFYRKASLPSNASHLSVNTSSTRANLENLTVYTEYAVHVAAFTSVGLGEPSAERTIFTQEGVPGAIEHVTAAALAHDSVLVSWLPPESANGVIVQYLVTYNSSDGNSTGSVSTEGQQNVNLTNLTPNTTYYIFVTAKTSQGFGRRGVTVNATTRTYIAPPPVTSSPTGDQTTVGVVPGGTEQQTGGLSQDRIIIIVVCVGLVFVFMIVAAVYFCAVRPRKHPPAGDGYTWSKKRTDLWSRGPAAFEMDSGKHGRQAVLDVHEEPSIADTSYSSDSFDSDWISSTVPSPSPKPPYSYSGEYANPADSAKRPAPGTATRPRERNKRVSVNSQDSLYDHPYSSVEELGGGFSSFGPPPPMAFRSTPLLAENSDTDSQASSQNPSQSSDKRKSFTNQLYKAALEDQDVDHGAKGVGSEGDMTGVENKGYDSDEALNEFLGNEMLKSAASPEPSDLDALYAKPDKSKKKRTFRKNGVPSAPLSDAANEHEQKPTAVDDLYAKPDKSKKKSREDDKLKTSSHDGEGDNSSSQATTPDHKPSVVYDERTNFSSDVAAPNESAPADKHDVKSVADSTWSSETLTVSDMNSSDTQGRDPTADDLIDFNHEEAIVPVTVPPPSPFTLRNRKLSFGSQDSFYDEPYSNLEEIDANFARIEASPIFDVNPVPLPGDDDVAADQTSGATKAMTEADQTSFATGQPFGVVDRPEDEAVVMEVKEIGSHTESKADEDHDGVSEPPKPFEGQEPTGKAEDQPRNSRRGSDDQQRPEEYDSVTLMF